jgi:hypothetical protein
MRHFAALLGLLLIVCGGCGSDDKSTNPAARTSFECPTSGTFRLSIGSSSGSYCWWVPADRDITVNKPQGSCSVIQIGSDSGTYDGVAHKGVISHYGCTPAGQDLSDCRLQQYTITFSDNDTFAGTLHLSGSLKLLGSAINWCSADYSITGKRKE